MVEFTKAYFIKLGRGGGWEKSCIKDGLIRLGFNNPYHKRCVKGQYNSLRNWLEQKGKPKGVVTSIVNQVKTFYEANEQTLWITFYQRRLWWGFAATGIDQLEDGSRVRKIKKGWRSTDANGDELTVDRISGRLTKIQMYQGTICKVKESSYLQDRINGNVPSEVTEVQERLAALIDAVLPLIQLLTWKDFELLVDLLFVNAGWKRVGVLGKTEKDIDLDLLMPVNGRRAFVQVKSSSTQTEFENYVEAFTDNDMYDEMYYVVHTLKHQLQVPECQRSVTILSDKPLAKLVVNSGIVDWLVKTAT